MKRVARLAVAAVALVCLSAQAAVAQVMQHVPSGSLVVIKVNSLKGLSDKVADMAKKMGVAQFLPPLADPLGSLEQNFHIANGLNASDDAAFAILDPDQYAGKKESAVLLLPVKDYKTFLTNFSRPTEASDKPAPDNTAATTQNTPPPVPDAQGIAAIAFPNAFETSYVAQWGDYAAISPIRQIVAKPGSGIKIAGLAGKEMQSKDFIIYANMPVIRAKVLPQLKANREKWTREFESAMKRNPSFHGGPMFNMFLDQAVNAAERFIEDSQAATYGISLEKTGIRTTIIAEFMPESPIGKSVAEFKDTDKSLLVGLPTEKYIFYGGMAWDPRIARKFFDQITAPARARLTTQPAHAQTIVKLLDLYGKAISALHSQALGWIAPSGPIGQSGLVNMVGVQTGDSAAILKIQRQSADLTKELMSENQDKQLKITSTYTENARQLDGVSFNQISTKFEPTNPNSPQARQMTQMMSMMYGPNGLTVLYGALDPQHIVMGMGVTDPVLTKLIETVKAGQDPLGTQAELKDVKANLPANRISAFYVPLDQIAATAAEYARQFGMPVNVQIPPGLPPIGMTAGTEQSAIRLDSFVPAQLVQSLVAAVQQAYMGMQNGGGPGT